MADRPVLTLAPVTAPSQQPPGAQAEPSHPPAASADAEASKQPKPGHGVKSSASRRRPGSLPAHGDKKSPVVSAALEFPLAAVGTVPSDRLLQVAARPCRRARQQAPRPARARRTDGGRSHHAPLLDQDDQTIRKLIDRAEQAKPRSGRGRHRAT
jgi:hypothetical protein